MECIVVSDATIVCIHTVQDVNTLDQMMGSFCWPWYPIYDILLLLWIINQLNTIKYIHSSLTLISTDSLLRSSSLISVSSTSSWANPLQPGWHPLSAKCSEKCWCWNMKSYGPIPIISNLPFFNNLNSRKQKARVIKL